MNWFAALLVCIELLGHVALSSWAALWGWFLTWTICRAICRPASSPKVARSIWRFSLSVGASCALWAHLWLDFSPASVDRLIVRLFGWASRPAFAVLAWLLGLLARLLA